jgi:acetyl esterase/lipase
MSFDVAAALDPEIAAALPDGPVGNFGSLTVDRIPAARAASSGLQMPPAPPTTVTSIVELPAGADGHRVQVRIYSPVGEGRDRPCVLWIHGGGYIFGSGIAPDMRDPRLHGWVAAFGCVVVSIDYRLAPEHPYPAALQDVTAAYRALAGQAGSAGHIVVSGESAGGNLAIELLIAGQAQGLTMPAAALLLSPMTDLTVTGSSYAGKAHADPAITAQAIRTRAADYLAGTDPADPLVSPIFADLSGLPPLLIQAGSHEVLLDDATRLAVKAAADDVAVILDITPGVPHVFQAFAALLDEGDAALNRAARFIRDNTSQKAAA